MAYTKLGRIRPVHKGAWSASAAYAALDMVRSGGVSYIANRDVPAGTPLTDGGYWAVVLDVSEVVEAAEGAVETIRNVADTKANPLKAAAAGNPVQVHPDGGSLLKPVTELKPIQPGSGDPYPAGGGKNLLPFMVKGKTFSANGMTAEVKDEGLVVNGTPSGSYNNLVNYELSLPAGTYTISGGDASKGVIAQMNVTNADGSASYYINTTFEVKGTEQRIVVMIQNGGGTPTMTNYVLKAQLERGSTASEFALYENIRPISGRTGAELTRCGKNLIPFTNTTKTANGVTFTPQADGRIHIKGTATGDAIYDIYGEWKGKSGISIPKGTNVKANTNLTGVFALIYGYMSDGSYKGMYSHYNTLPETITDTYVYLQVNSGVVVDGYFTPVLTMDGWATTYEPYQGDTFTLDFGQTVCGGVLDWNKGVLMVDEAMVTLTGAEMWNDYGGGGFLLGVLSDAVTPGYNEIPAMICSHYPAAMRSVIAENKGIGVGIGSKTHLIVNPGTGYTADTFKSFITAQYAAGTPVQVAYKLATPVTIQLTPQQITALAGANTLYTDGDGMTVDYNRSIADAYEELRNAIIAMGGYV